MCLAVEPDLRVVGAVRNSREALLLAQSAAPDVIVMDIEMPVAEGVRAIRQIQDLLPGCAVVVLAMSEGRDTRARALGAGASAFVEKQGGAAPLLREIRRLAAGGAGP